MSLQAAVSNRATPTLDVQRGTVNSFFAFYYFYFTKRRGHRIL